MGEFRRESRGGFGGGDRGGFGGRSGGRPSFPRKSFGGGDRDRGPVTMHKVVCDECHKPCEVPFRPTDGKPVYCSECFGGKKNFGNDRGGDRFPRKSFDSGRSSERNDFAPSANKGSDEGVKKQLETISLKLDTLVKSIESLIKPAQAEVKEKKNIEKVSKKVVEKKPKAKIVVAKKTAKK